MKGQGRQTPCISAPSRDKRKTMSHPRLPCPPGANVVSPMNRMLSELIVQRAGSLRVAPGKRSLRCGLGSRLWPPVTEDRERREDCDGGLDWVGGRIPAEAGTDNRHIGPAGSYCRGLSHGTTEGNGSERARLVAFRISSRRKACNRPDIRQALDCAFAHSHIGRVALRERAGHRPASPR